jgi:hypothetical protein
MLPVVLLLLLKLRSRKRVGGELKTRKIEKYLLKLSTATTLLIVWAVQLAVSFKQGSTLEQVNKELNDLFDYCRSQVDEDKGNIVADVLDCIVGWCNPQFFLPSEPS